MKLVETVVGRLYIGSKDDVLTLFEQPKEKLFDIIWNLAEELGFLLDDERAYSNRVLHGEIKDYSIPHHPFGFKTQLEQVTEVLNAGGSAAIHCFGGHGRTGMALAAIKMRLEGLTADEAIAFAMATCNGPETKEQEDFIRTL